MLLTQNGFFLIIFYVIIPDYHACFIQKWIICNNVIHVNPSSRMDK